MDDREQIVVSREHSLLKTMMAFADYIPKGYPVTELPKIKPLHGMAITCVKCGRRNVTLKKTGENKYECLECFGKGVYLNE